MIFIVKLTALFSTVYGILGSYIIKFPTCCNSLHVRSPPMMSQNVAYGREAADLVLEQSLYLLLDFCVCEHEGR